MDRQSVLAPWWVSAALALLLFTALGGVDLRLRRDGHLVVVQCKKWKGKPVSVQTVRELYGVVIDQRASAAKLVATTSFTPDAVAIAKGKPIELVDSKALLRLVRDVQTTSRITVSSNEPDHLTPNCPMCSTPMVMREARRGPNPGEKFWGAARDRSELNETPIVAALFKIKERSRILSAPSAATHHDLCHSCIITGL